MSGEGQSAVFAPQNNFQLSTEHRFQPYLLAWDPWTSGKILNDVLLLYSIELFQTRKSNEYQFFHPEQNLIAKIIPKDGSFV